ncbi:unnamed protein product [Mytilus coruscus]|uniref:Uncharacterized protein n=1 Tax=Mytilus coruscus TaxID=42192 RepID=A0A6J8E6Z0_MYTCO|nr:unnamed protein product [Mytilus coruscus]
MAKSKSQRMKEYRERKKASLGEKWLIQEGNRTREYYKPTSQLNSEEKKARRKRIRDNVSAYRKRQTALLNKTNDVALLKEADLHGPNPLKSQNTLRKRLEREKKRNSEKKNTPRSKTDALIQRAGLTPGTRDTENIRKKLVRSILHLQPADDEYIFYDLSEEVFNFRKNHS